MINWLNYHHLYYFRAIAVNGSIAKASAVLNVGASSLSAQLKNLENSLDQKLFERKNKQLILTEAGKIALKYADDIFQKGEEFVQVFNNKSLSLKANYNIGVVASAPKSLACRLMEEAQKFGDNSFITMSEDSPGELVKKVNNVEIDLALTSNLAILGIDELNITPIGESSVSIYGAKKFTKLKKGFPQSLNNQPFILPTNHSKLRYDIDHLFKSLNINYDIIAEVQDSSVKKMMGEHGKGLLFLPDFAAKALVKEGRLYKIGCTNMISEEYWLLSKKRTIKSQVTEKIISTFRI